MSDKAKGNIVAFAIILTAMILVAGFAVGTVVLEGSRRANEMDRAVGAYYMANSGIEMQLYDFRKNDLKLLDIGAVSYANLSLYPGGSKWLSTTGYETSTVKTIPFLGNEEFSFVDLFDPEDVTKGSGIDRIDVSWDAVDPACMPDLEIGYTVWDVGTAIQWATSTADYTIVIAPKADHASIPAFSLPVFAPAKAYRLRVRPFNCAVKDIRLSMFDLGVPKAYPGEIVLGSEGSYQKTNQRLRVTMPRQDILSGIFSYIVFSQEQLCKRVGAAAVGDPCM
jgi:hypothetical protein